MLYISDSIFPSTNADSLQVLNTINALNQNNLETHLLGLKVAEGTPQLANANASYVALKKIKGFLFYFTYKAWRKAKKEDHQIVFTRHLLSATLLPVLGYKTFYEVHNTYWLTSVLPLAWIKRAFQKMSGFVCITNSLKTKLLQDHPQISEERVLVSPDASYPNPGEMLEGLELDKTKIHLGYTGSFHPGKGVPLLLRIAEELPETYVLHIVGGPVPEVLLKDKPKNVVFHGVKPYADIPKFLNHIDIALLPNQTNMKTGKKSGDIANYTSPLKLFDYMASGTCIVSSDIPVLREVINENNAMLVDPSQPLQWKNAIVSLSQDKDLRKKLGNQAQRDFLSNYSWDSRAKNLISFINKWT